MTGGDGCLCLTLDERGVALLSENGLTLNVGSLDRSPTDGDGAAEVDLVTDPVSVLVRFTVAGAPQSVEGDYHSDDVVILGDYVVTPPDYVYPIALDREPATCAERLGVGGPTC
jgi:hypothetical protein